LPAAAEAHRHLDGAPELRTAEETFGKMQAFAKRKKIAPFIEKIVLGSGDEAIHFTNGSRILFGARERGFGRGFDEVDVLIFDEAQILTENALDDMIPATNQSRQDTGALLLFMGTPPKPKDPGEVFTRMRTEALSGEDDDTCWIEFGTDPDFTPTPLPAPLGAHDWEQIAKANPSFPDDTPARRSCGCGRSSDRSRSSARDAASGTTRTRSRSTSSGPGSGPAAARPGSSGCSGRDRYRGLGRSASRFDRGSVDRRDRPPDDPEGEPVERVYVAPVERRDGVAWTVAEAKRIQDKYDCMVVIDEKGPTKDSIKDLEDADVAVEAYTLDEYAEACSRFFDKVQAGEVLHPLRPRASATSSTTPWPAPCGARSATGRSGVAASPSPTSRCSRRRPSPRTPPSRSARSTSTDRSSPMNFGILEIVGLFLLVVGCWVHRRRRLARLDCARRAHRRRVPGLRRRPGRLRRCDALQGRLRRRGVSAVTLLGSVLGARNALSAENPEKPLTDTSLLEMLGMEQTLSGKNVNEITALGLPAVWRAMQVSCNVPAALAVPRLPEVGDARVPASGHAAAARRPAPGHDAVRVLADRLLPPARVGQRLRAQAAQPARPGPSCGRSTRAA
jgi:hypothetical protein